MHLKFDALAKSLTAKSAERCIESFDWAQEPPFDWAQEPPFDWAQEPPFGWAQEPPVEMTQSVGNYGQGDIVEIYLYLRYLARMKYAG
ncbi:MAG: hypothetical protein L3J79_09580 [Candidatus Marinimicrobia bacterium]|nr:hypothetical protein [Candidatus Neomarinimicrobiota bacterium]